MRIPLAVLLLLVVGMPPATATCDATGLVCDVDDAQAWESCNESGCSRDAWSERGTSVGVDGLGVRVVEYESSYGSDRTAGDECSTVADEWRHDERGTAVVINGGLAYAEAEVFESSSERRYLWSDACSDSQQSYSTAETGEGARVQVGTIGAWSGAEAGREREHVDISGREGEYEYAYVACYDDAYGLVFVSAIDPVGSAMLYGVRGASCTDLP